MGGDVAITGTLDVQGTATSTFDGGAILARNAGNVGIGTATPSHLLSVAGDILVGGTATSTFEGNVNLWGNLVLGQNTTYITENDITASQGFSINSDAANKDIVLNSSGAVGFNTSTPWAFLSIDHDFADDDKPVLVVADQGTSTPSFLIDWARRVGISTSTLGNKLEVAGFGVVKGNWNVEATSTASSFNATSTLSVASSSPTSQFAVVGKSVFGGDVNITGNVDIQGTCTGCGGNPGGSNTQIQFNNSSAFGGSSGLTFASNNLTLTGDLFVNGSDINVGNGSLATTTISGMYGRLGFASTTPYGQISIEADNTDISGVGSNTPIFVVGDQGSSTPFLYVSGNDGFVGVATDSPAQPFSVDSNAYIGALGVGSATTSAGGLFVKGSADIYDGLIVRGGSAGAATDLLFVRSGGVGIGTSTIGSRLEVAGFGVVKGNWNIEATSTASSFNATSTLSVASSSPTSQFAVVGKSVFGGDVNITGNVDIQGTCTGCGTALSNVIESGALTGIATNTPWATLAVEHNASVDFDTPVFVVGDTGTDTPSFLINYNGDVGIGVEVPRAKLDVGGAIVASTTLYSSSGYKKLTAGRTLITVDTAGGRYMSAGILPDGSVAISYADENVNDLRYVKCGNASCSSGNTLSVLDSGITIATAMAIPSDGLPIIAHVWYTGSAYALRAVKCGNPTCTYNNTFTTIDSTTGVGIASITIAPDGLPVIAYNDGTNNDLEFVKCGNSACSSGNTLTTVDSAVSGGNPNSITIGSDGLPIIAYRDSGNGDLKIVKCGNATCAANNTTTSIDTDNNVGSLNGIAIAPDGLPVVAYNDATANALKVLKCGNTACSANNTITTVDSVNVVTTSSSIVIAPDGLPIISYVDFTDKDLQVLKCGNATCSANNTTATLDASNVIARETSILIGTDGLPAIAYYDNTNAYLKFAKCVDLSCTSTSEEVSAGGGFLGIKGGSPSSYGSVFGEIAAIAIHNPTSFQNFSILQNNVERFTIGTTSNIGIGSTTPWGLLSVEQVEDTSANNELLPAFVVGDSGTSAPSFIVMNGTGRAGFGTSSPQAQVAIEITEEGSSNESIPAFLISSRGTSTPIFTVVRNQQSAVANTNTFSIGIGTTTPYGALSIDTTDIMIGIPALLIRAGATSNVAIQVDSGDNCKDGADAAVTCALNDLAELFRVSDPFDSAQGKSLEAGDLAMIDPENPVHLKKATQDKRNLLAGPISTSPAIVFEGSGLKALGGVYQPEENKVPLTLSGRVPVKVNLENGPIQIGDPITISSVPGIGTKANTEGKIIGYALENYTQQDYDNDQNNNKQGKILVLTNLENWSIPVALSSSPESGWLANVIDTIVNWLKETVVNIKEIITDKITTKQLCVGDTCVNEEQLKALLNTNNLGTSDVPNTSGEPAESIDGEPPVITLNGANPAQIEKGSAYSDMGATITDNVSQNLGYKLILKKGDAILSGSEESPEIYPNELVLDTSVAAEYTITYIATDGAGNTGTATRTVTVFDPNAPLEEPAPEELPPEP